jgi:hypothetical protein
VRLIYDSAHIELSTIVATKNTSKVSTDKQMLCLPAVTRRTQPMSAGLSSKWREEHFPQLPCAFLCMQRAIPFVTSVHEETGRCPIDDSLIQSGEESISTSSDVLFNPRREHIIHEIRFVSMCRSVMDPRNGQSSRAERALPTAFSASLSMQRALLYNLRVSSTSRVGGCLAAIQAKPKI